MWSRLVPSGHSAARGHMRSHLVTRSPPKRSHSVTCSWRSMARAVPRPMCACSAKLAPAAPSGSAPSITRSKAPSASAKRPLFTARMAACASADVKGVGR
eukprot:1901125-Pyramimonas_sp.AAC.1